MKVYIEEIVFEKAERFYNYQIRKWIEKVKMINKNNCDEELKNE